MWTGASASADDRDALGAVTELVPSVLGESAAIAADAGAVEVVVPVDAADGIELSAPGFEDLVIELPCAEDAQLSCSGERPFFDSGGGNFTVPLVKDDGAEILDADGGLHTMSDGPWALAASGDGVPSHDTVDGATLAQVVDVAAATALPVVADPTISFGWAAYVQYSESDARTAATGLGGANNDKAMCGFILCGKTPHWAAMEGYALLGTSLHRSIYTTFTYAKDHRQCGEVQLVYISHLPVVWKGYSC